MQYSKNYYQIKSNETIFNLIKEESKSIGYYNLPFEDTTNIKDFALTVKQKNIVVVGIGGSSLGTYAIHKFLKQKIKKISNKKLHFLESTDPIDLEYRMDKIDFSDAMFIIISKSGNTIETVSIFKYLHSKIDITSKNCTIISEDDSSLTAYAKEHNIKRFSIAKNVGGRFSVFSAVGLLPLACIGVDIDQLLMGCKKIHNSFFSKDEFYAPIMEKARFMVENKNRFNINVIFSYSSLLEGFNKWYIQLWGESLGKININNTKQALTPIALLGPVDQHSFLQLIMQGVRDKTVTFIKVDDFKSTLSIPSKSLKYLDELDYLNNIKFQDLINHQADATIASIEAIKDIPCDTITIEKIDEYNIAKLMFSYQLLTSIIGKFLQIDTYNQPGVEDGKIKLKDKLDIINKP
jgi:glucose-6-phosphate isomerase